MDELVSYQRRAGGNEGHEGMSAEMSVLGDESRRR